MTITVQPIYGNGWTSGPNEVPEPHAFEVNADHSESGMIFGDVISSADEGLLGAKFKAALRHKDEYLYYNCRIELLNGEVWCGYCMIN